MRRSTAIPSSTSTIQVRRRQPPHQRRPDAARCRLGVHSRLRRQLASADLGFPRCRHQVFGFDPAGPHDENIAVARAERSAGVSHSEAGHRLYLAQPDGRGVVRAASLNVESVAWIAERKTMLSTLLLSARAGSLSVVRQQTRHGIDYASPAFRARPDEQAADHHAAAGPAAVGLLATAAYVRREPSALARASKRFRTPEPVVLVKEKFPLFFICMVDAGVTLVAQHVAGGRGALSPLDQDRKRARLLHPLYREMLLAVESGLYYPHPGNSLHWWQWAGPFIALAASPS